MKENLFKCVFPTEVSKKKRIFIVILAEHLRHLQFWVTFQRICVFPQFLPVTSHIHVPSHFLEGHVVVKMSFPIQNQDWYSLFHFCFLFHLLCNSKILFIGVNVAFSMYLNGKAQAKIGQGVMARKGCAQCSWNRSTLRRYYRPPLHFYHENNVTVFIKSHFWNKELLVMEILIQKILPKFISAKGGLGQSSSSLLDSAISLEFQVAVMIFIFSRTSVEAERDLLICIAYVSVKNGTCRKVGLTHNLAWPSQSALQWFVEKGTSRSGTWI